MAQYIDKDDLISKIKDLKFKLNWALEDFSGAKEIAYDNVLDAIYGSEVKKEVDFEKESKMWIEENQDTAGFFDLVEYAKHFFERGLEMNQKGE